MGYWKYDNNLIFIIINYAVMYKLLNALMQLKSINQIMIIVVLSDYR